MASSLRPTGSHPIRVAAWHLELLSGGQGRDEDLRPVAEKLGTVRQDPDLHGLLFLLISRATGGRQERAAQLCRNFTTCKGRGLIKGENGDGRVWVSVGLYGSY